MADGNGADTQASKIQILRTLHTMLESRSLLASRAGLSFEGERDTYKYLGYKRDLQYADYQSRYRRGGIASRLVDAYPQATWRQQPILLDPGKQSEEPRSKFVTSFDAMAKRLKLYYYFERADKLAGIGKYSVILIGVKGVKSLETKIAKINSFDDILYVMPYSEANATVDEKETSTSSPRYGLPKTYTLKMGDKVPDKKVHYSRILHIAEGLLEDEIYGRPRMESVWNYMDDLDKIMGGSAEAVWRGVDRGIQFDVDKDSDLSDEDEDEFADEISEYMHNLKRYIRTRGVTANVLESNIASIEDKYTATISLIAGTLGIPVRILTGSERGQLASSTDDRNFNSRVKERQQSYAETVLLRAFIEKLGDAGIELSDYQIAWPDVSTSTDREKSDIAARYGQAIRNVSQQEEGREVIMPEDFKKRFIDD